MSASRRAFLQGAAAVPLAGLPVTSGGDGELLRLGVQFERAWEREALRWRDFPDAILREEYHRRWDVAERAARATGAVVEAIECAQARTLAGVLVKVRACSHCHSGEPFDGTFLWDKGCRATTDLRLAEAVLRDLMAIDGRPVPVTG